MESNGMDFDGVYQSSENMGYELTKVYQIPGLENPIRNIRIDILERPDTNPFLVKEQPITPLYIRCDTATRKKGGHMAKKRKNQDPLIDGENLLLSIKDILDQILRKAETMNPTVKESIVAARDAAWNQFIKEQESNMPGRNTINS
jgi:hypothetical protein